MADAAESKKGGILSDFSFVQVFSSALAAITSTLLSAHIGIIGGIVAVGVGAAVSAMASQVYKALLEASHQKLKEVAQDQTTLIPGSAAQTLREQREVQGASQRETQDVTQRMAKAERAKTANVRIAPGYLRSRAQQDRRRKIVAAALIAAVTLAAVGATAAVINIATKGDGLGTKTNFGTVLTQQSPTTSTDASSTGTTTQNSTATTSNTSTNTQSTSNQDSSAQSSGEQEAQDSTQSSSDSEDGSSTSTDSSSEDTAGTSDSSSSDGNTSESNQNSQQGSSDKTDGTSGTTENTSSNNANSGHTTPTKSS